MPHNLLFRRLLSTERLLQGGSDAASCLLRVSLRPPHIPAGRGEPAGGPPGGRREARRDPLLQERQ
jgi:hypothetical protein